MYTLLKKKYFLLVLLSILFMLAACGSNTQTTQMQGSTPTQSAHATKTVSAQPSPTVPGITPTATQAPKPMQTPPSNNAIVVTTDKTGYAANSTITVTVTNNLSAGIYASAYYTNCTPMQLQLKNGAAWTMLSRCPESTQTALVIQAGSSRVFVLRPSARPMTSHMGSSTAWTAGTYRISFNYTLQPDPDTSQGGINIVSAEFTISS